MSFSRLVRWSPRAEVDRRDRVFILKRFMGAISKIHCLKIGYCDPEMAGEASPPEPVSYSVVKDYPNRVIRVYRCSRRSLGHALLSLVAILRLCTPSPLC